MGPNHYLHTLVPSFPDYFQVNGNHLELVCWSSDFAVDNKFNKWVDDWQKLPYVSPYQKNVNVLSGESDKWVVGLLHEVLHLLVPKKTDKDNLLVLGDYLGVRSRFKKALLQHPGIFYVSSKLHTHTVVLREAYKRDLLVTKPRHPVMTLRSSYIHLMNIVMEKNKSKNVDVTGVKKKEATQDSNEGEGDEFSETESEHEEDDSDFEDANEETWKNRNKPRPIYVKDVISDEPLQQNGNSDKFPATDNLSSTGRSVCLNLCMTLFADNLVPIRLDIDVEGQSVISIKSCERIHQIHFPLAVRNAILSKLPVHILTKVIWAEQQEAIGTNGVKANE
ncbi:protein WHAT'S THIS FACTOR 9, mitochondrial [Tanacetum coccineum]